MKTYLLNTIKLILLALMALTIDLETVLYTLLIIGIGLALTIIYHLYNYKYND